jgi:hypothetical protein
VSREPGAEQCGPGGDQDVETHPHADEDSAGEVERGDLRAARRPMIAVSASTSSG